MRLKDKATLITGGGSGIGRATALRFAEEGARVAVADIDEALAKETAELVQAAGGEALVCAADVTREESVSAMVDSAVSGFGGLDVLYNCAGGSIPSDSPITEVDLSVWDHTISLDLKGTMLCCRHAIPHMIAGGGGSIINSSSLVAIQGGHPMHVYSAAKGGIMSFTRAIAGTYGKDRVRANVICPGLILSQRMRDRVGERGQNAALSERHPFGVGEPVDIANVALFLASDESRMITATEIRAEGGLSNF